MLECVDVDIDDLDYLVINHMEPDHSGWIESLKQVKGDFKIVCTRASKNLLDAFYGREEEVIVVKDGDTLNLGNDRILEFVTTPNVHWPDSMVTYDRLSRTLLSCDVFGTYGVVEGKHFDDELSDADLSMFEEEGARYFANIISAFTDYTKKRQQQNCLSLKLTLLHQDME